jgi:Zn-dependent protease/predicted transcriptional regulator
MANAPRAGFLDERGGVPLFRVGGTLVRIDLSWLLIFLLVLWSLSAGYLPNELPGQARRAYWLAGLVSTLLFFGSVLLHELSHTIVARKNGIRVPSITLFVFGGAAEAADEPATPQAELRIAIVGPLTSFALAAGFWLVAGLAAGELPPLVVVVLRYLAGINLALGVFNLLPGLPLDGGRVLRALTWRWTGSRERASWVASRAGQGLGVGLAVLGAYNFFTGNLVGGVWLVLIGLFLRGVAQASYQGAVTRQALDGVRVSDVMARDVVAVPADLSVQELIDDYLIPTGHRSFPVVEGERVLGLVSLDSIRGVPPAERARVRVAERLERAGEAPRIAPDATLSAAIAAMHESGARRLLVADPAGHVVGFLTGTGLARFLEMQQALAPRAAEPPSSYPEARGPRWTPSPS